jgi:hypothetical protein
MHNTMHVQYLSLNAYHVFNHVISGSKQCYLNVYIL